MVIAARNDQAAGTMADMRVKNVARWDTQRSADDMQDLADMAALY